MGEALERVGLEIKNSSTYTLDSFNTTDSLNKQMIEALSGTGVLNRFVFPGGNPFDDVNVEVFDSNIVLCWNGNTELGTDASQLLSVAAGKLLSKDQVSTQQETQREAQ